MFFGDRVGWEGDDLAIIESSTHLDVKPFDTLYRYPWQPLSIRAAHWLTRHGVPALSLTYLPNILGAIGIVALAETLAVILGTSTGVWIAYGLVLAIPELWITILYFNTTALGLPFFCGAFLLLAPAVRNEKAWFWRVALAAILYAVSCLFRLDFATASLALLLIVYALTPVRKWFAVLLFMFVSGTVGLAGLLYLGAGPAEILRTFRLYEDEPQSEKLSIVIFLLAVLPLVLMSSCAGARDSAQEMAAPTCGFLGARRPVRSSLGVPAESSLFREVSGPGILHRPDRFGAVASTTSSADR